MFVYYQATKPKNEDKIAQYYLIKMNLFVKHDAFFSCDVSP